MSRKTSLRKVAKKTTIKTVAGKAKTVSRANTAKKAAKLTSKSASTKTQKTAVSNKKPSRAPSSYSAKKTKNKPKATPSPSEDMISDSSDITLNDIDSRLRVLLEITSDIKKTQKAQVEREYSKGIQTAGLVQSANDTLSAKAKSDSEYNKADSAAKASAAQLLQTQSNQVHMIKMLQSKLHEANQSIRALNSEVDKRNQELSRLTDSYQNLKDIHNSNTDETSQIKKSLNAKDEMSVALLSDMEKYKRQLAGADKQTENLYAKLVESEKNTRTVAEENKRLKEKIQDSSSRFNSMSAEIDRKVSEITARMQSDKNRIALDSEKRIAQQLHRVRILQDKISELNRIIAEQQRSLAVKDRKLSVLTETYRKIDDLDSSPLMPERKSRSPSFDSISDSRNKSPYQEHDARTKRLAEIPKLQTRKDMAKEVHSGSSSGSSNQKEPLPGHEPFTTFIQAPHNQSHTLPYSADEIVHMVRVAHEHGDTEDQIKHSLISSGYDPSEVDRAIRRVLQ